MTSTHFHTQYIVVNYTKDVVVAIADKTLGSTYVTDAQDVYYNV